MSRTEARPSALGKSICWSSFTCCSSLTFPASHTTPEAARRGGIITSVLQSCLQSKTFLKLAAQRCQLHLRRVLKRWWGSEKWLWKWHLVIAHTWLVGRQIPLRVISAGLADKNKLALSSQCACWKPVKGCCVPQPWTPSWDPQGFCTPVKAWTSHICAAQPGEPRGCSQGLLHGA